MDITLSSDGPKKPSSRIPPNSKPAKWILLHGEKDTGAYGWWVWETNDGHEKSYFSLGGSSTKLPRIYKWTVKDDKRWWSCRNSNKYRSPEGLDEQELWKKYGRRD